MFRTLSSPVGRLLLLALGTTAGVAIAVLPGQVGQAAGTVRTCTVAVTHVGLETSTYADTFTVTTGQPFTDNRSTPVRADVFTATVVKNVVSVDWFKEVNGDDDIDLAVDVDLRGGHGHAHGLSQYASPSSGHHTTTYDVTCR